MTEDTPGTSGTSDTGDFAWIESLFDRLVDLDPTARMRAIEEATANRPDLRDEIEALLTAHDRVNANGGEDEPPGIGPGSLIGAYRLLDRIGVGGMGEVFRGERADGVFAGLVAIKLTRPGVASHDLLRRFRVERQILATLKHPNIVTLHDGGATATGQAYLIMEYVDGVPVTEYCRAHALTLQDRLRLFLEICKGVHHAHRHAVVHRDLKPANVLVGQDGVPKVVDFGIAKLLDQEAGADATAVGLTPGPLTPNYASPEQLRGLPVTTSTDIYALGVILYELVAGVRPYDTQGQTLDRVLEIVMHTEPARPSAARAAESAPSLPYRRADLGGDVDAIVLKAMHKDPAARYASAGELARDIERHLGGDPILARPPSTGDVLRRLAARHKALVAVTSLAVVAILAALGVALWQRQIARREQARAEQRFRDVRQLANALIFKIHDAVTPLPGSTPVRRTILAEAIGYLERLEAESAGDVPLTLELAAAYRQLGGILGDPQRANLGARDEALRMFERARKMTTPLVTRTAHYDIFQSVIDANAALAAIHSQGGDRTSALAAAREALDYAKQFEQARPRDDRGATLVGRASFTVALLLPTGESRPVWEETLAIYERLLAATPTDANAQRNVALVCKYLAPQIENAGDLDGALPCHRRALELDEQRLLAAPNDHRIQFDAAISFSNLASNADRRGDVETAAPLYARSLALRRAMAAADPMNVQARHRLGFLLGRLAFFNRERDPVSGLAQAKESAEVLQRVFDTTGDRESRLDLAYAWMQTAFAEQRFGRRAASCAAFRRAGTLYDTGGVLTTSNHASSRESVLVQLRACEK